MNVWADNLGNSDPIFYEGNLNGVLSLPLIENIIDSLIIDSLENQRGQYDTFQVINNSHIFAAYLG